MLGVCWKDWCWSWNSNTLATSCEELTHLKRPWCWERLRVGGEGDDRGWAGWLASLTQWTWVWVGSGSCWWTGRPDVLWFMGLQRVRHNWMTELNLQFQEQTRHFFLSLFFLLCDMWDLSSTTSAEYTPPAVRVHSLHHWTTGEAPHIIYFQY